MPTAPTATVGDDPAANRPSWYVSPKDITDRSANPIGRGGFGEVYTGSYYGSKVAIKQLMGTYNKRELVEYHHEINIWHKLSHPHILPLLGACDKDESGNQISPFMISPFMPNGTLRDFVSDPDKPCSLGGKLALLYQVASGISYLHARRIIHGDLKAANVLLDQSLRAVVSDFGLSRTKHTSASLERNRSSLLIGGTQGYLAPEMLHEENPSGNSMKTDVYAFAITMYEVLNDAKPVWVTTDGQPMRDRVIETQVCKGNRPKRIDNIPDDIWTMVERCWHQVPDQRPTFVEILGWLEPFKALHSPPEPKPRSTQGADSHPSASSQDARTPTPRQRESESYPGVSRLMLQRARKGDPDACLLVAKTITSSKDTTSTGWAEAATFLQTAADHESLDAYFYLGWMYFLGLGVQQSDLDALEYWREVSTRSTDPISKPIATHMLGWLLYLGRGTAPDIGKGIMLIRQSKTSEFGLGEDELMSSDTLISSDSATAAHFFHLCQLGLEHQWLCKHLVGVCYVHGFGSAQDQQRAADLFEELAGQGHDTSQYWLGKCLDRGWGRPIDVPAKYKWYLAAAEGGNSYAQNMIGRMHEVGSHVSKDDSCAAKWYRKSAEQGNKFGQNNLGWCYQAGCGVGQDPSVAIEWYRKSAEQGHSSGQNNLGACFFNGCGVASDLPKAIEWYQKSAEQGNVYAQWNLALNYEYGNGIEKDMATALSWYRKAAENGHSSASDRLQVLSP